MREEREETTGGHRIDRGARKRKMRRSNCPALTRVLGASAARLRVRARERFEISARVVTFLKLKTREFFVLHPPLRVSGNSGGRGGVVDAMKASARQARIFSRCYSRSASSFRGECPHSAREISNSRRDNQRSRRRDDDSHASIRDTRI